ncbi:MAG: hypothetical protein P4L72_15880 [Parvibaculum sp.]|uniref:hypothetical protein n=1 Tax=Parvibaculum sp. TaxID=2024848 RepID=UPI002851F7C2|nr:hypothetical protein [Parvibaculum sp.]MDR3500694.1 hypothetical protein [Parvibaculum sp.]
MKKPAAKRQPARITKKQYKDAYRAYFHYAGAIRDTLAKRYGHLELAVDPIVALNVAVATYDDIDRFKSYHLRNDGDARSDVVKRAAYFAKWTSKLRPIMFKRTTDAPAARDMGLMVNELLALAYAMELMSSELGRNIRLSNKTHSELLYDLHYREIADDALLAIFQLIADLARARKDNPIIEFNIS